MRWYPRSRPSNFKLTFYPWGFSTTLKTNLAVKIQPDHLFSLVPERLNSVVPEMSIFVILHLKKIQLCYQNARRDQLSTILKRSRRNNHLLMENQGNLKL